jgi:hypothetical protein
MVKILLIVEDSFGTRSLIKHFCKFNIVDTDGSNRDSDEWSSGVNVDLHQGLQGNDTIFNISQNLINTYDYIIIFNDMDARPRVRVDNLVLNDQKVRRSIRDWYCKNKYNEEERIELYRKLVYIPVFCCFETLALYSINNLVNISDAVMKNISRKYLCLSPYYDVLSIKHHNDNTVMSPQEFYGIWFTSAIYNRFGGVFKWVKRLS